MRAALITEYRKPLVIADVEDPRPVPGGVVLRVEASGICKSDWHAWMGHEDLPGLPHVPGHEMVGVVETVGSGVSTWRVGDRVVVPFSIGCGECGSCRQGHLNTCDDAFTPGFSAWGSFAELVAIDHAEVNLVAAPDGMDSIHASALGCRFITAFRAVVDRGRVQPGDWMAVYGCGGVGLSAVMIGSGLGAKVIAIDVDDRSLQMAEELGAHVVVNPADVDPEAAVREASHGGAHVSIDAVGTTETAVSSIGSLRKHGRHVQVGLMLAEHARPSIPMESVIMGELEILGVRGMPATDYRRVFDLISSGRIDPRRLVTATVPLEGISGVLEQMGGVGGVGVIVVDRF